jgi:hypothetical protein
VHDSCASSLPGIAWAPAHRRISSLWQSGPDLASTGHVVHAVARRGASRPRKKDATLTTANTQYALAA